MSGAITNKNTPTDLLTDAIKRNEFVTHKKVAITPYFVHIKPIVLIIK
jgi:hypothetical protein